MRLMIAPPANDDATFLAALQGPAEAMLVDAAGPELPERCAAARSAGKTLGLHLPARSAIDCDDKIAAAVAANPDFVLAPGISCRADFECFSAKLAAREALTRRRDGATRILAQIAAEPEAIFALSRFGGPKRRLIGLILDVTALADRLGIDAGRHDAAPLSFARATLALAGARAQAGAHIDLRRGWSPELLTICARENFAGALIGQLADVAPAQRLCERLRKC